jgi:hypothetical protein
MKKITALLVCVILISFASAWIHKQNEDLEFSIGSLSDRCLISSINTPSKSITLNSEGIDDGHSFNFKIGGGNYSELGEYCHIIYCEKDEEFDFQNICFEVTPDGQIITLPVMFFYLFILSLLIGLTTLFFRYSAPKMSETNEYNLYIKSNKNRFLFYVNLLKNKLYIFGILGAYVSLWMMTVFFTKMVISLNVVEFVEISKVSLILISWASIPFALFWIGYIIMTFYRGTERVLKYQFGVDRWR